MSTYKIRIQRTGGIIFRWQAFITHHPDQGPDDPFPPPPDPGKHGPLLAITRGGIEARARRMIRRMQQDHEAATETIDG